MRWLALGLVLLVLAAPLAGQERPRARELGIVPGLLPTGPLNAITDVPGVAVGHATLREGDSIRTGVIAVPLRTESEFALMVVANVITITPGTITIEAKGSPAVLYVNVLHLHDIDKIRRNLLRIEELSVRAFGSREARRQLDAEVVADRGVIDRDVTDQEGRS